jgi:hypothetical protein
MFKIWLAGFLDADGSVGLSKRGKLDYQRRPEVEFYNCDAILLQSIIDVYGGKIVKRTYSNPKWNNSYSLRYEGDKALQICIDCYPYMRHSKKHQRAKLIAEEYKAVTPRNGRYTDEMLEKRRDLNRRVMDIQMRGAGAY